MPSDLCSIYGGLAGAVPTDPSTGGSFSFSSKSLPTPDSVITTDKLVVRRLYHNYDPAFRIDALWFYADRCTYRALALLVLSVLFHEQPESVQLRLLHEGSDIKNVVIEYQYLGQDADWYQTRPFSFRYTPELTSRQPWHSSAMMLLPDDLPCFSVTNLDDSVANDDQWRMRDTVRGFGTDRACILLSELLLNAGCPDNPISRYDLEAEGPYRAVGPHSAEVRFFVVDDLGKNNAEQPI